MAVRQVARMSPSILVVEDEPSLAQVLSENLVDEGYDVETVGDGTTALERWRSDPPDLVVLDVMLPSLDGFEMCRVRRAEGDLTPRSSAYSVLYDLVSRVSETHKLRLNRIEVDMTRNLVQVYGETSSPQTVDLLVTELEQLECLRSIKKDKLQVKSDTETNFELQINASGCT